MDKEPKRTWIRFALNEKDLKLTIEAAYSDGTKPKRERDYIDYCSQLVTLIEIQEVVKMYVQEYRLQIDAEDGDFAKTLLEVADRVLNEGGQ